VIKAIIFDIGGVLAEDVWEHLLLDEKIGVADLYHLDRQHVRKIGKELWNIFAFRSLRNGESWESLEKDYWTAFIEKSGISARVNDLIQITDAFIKPVSGMLELLERLHSEGIGLAICSNNTEFWFHRQMEKLGLHKLFCPEKIILSCRIGTSKSSPLYEMFKTAVESLQVDRTNCLFIDDRNENIQRAIEFGLTGILFPSHSASSLNDFKLALIREGLCR
jgi:HAD superfamily hydrolase (TIGR01509 family)